MEPEIDQGTTLATIAPDQPHRIAGARRRITALLLVLTVGVAAYVLSGHPDMHDATNLVGLVGSVQIAPEPLLETSDAADVEELLRSRVGYRLLVPNVVGASITSVGTWSAGRNLRIPVVTYDDPRGDITAALILNYALLDKMSDSVFLDRSVRLDLEQERSYTVVSTNDNREVVVWRVGDDIFVAIAENGAGSLIPRISQPRSGPEG